MGLRQLGKSHVKYGVKPEYYPIVKETMLETIDEILGESCRKNTLASWSNALDFVIEQMSGIVKKENSVVAKKRQNILVEA
jgi:hemoglobin-like flavoprotein